MRSVFRDSVNNVKTIRKHGHEVIFGLDATNLSHYFDVDEQQQHQQQYDHTNPPVPTNITHTHRKRTFDRIQFNFPHWKGKTNILKRERDLAFNPGTSLHMYIFSDWPKIENVIEYDSGSNTSALEVPLAIQLYSFFSVLIALPPQPLPSPRSSPPFHRTPLHM